MQKVQSDKNNDQLKKVIEDFAKERPEITNGNFEHDLKIFNELMAQSEIDYENRISQETQKRNAAQKDIEANRYSIYGNLKEFKFNDFIVETKEQKNVIVKALIITNRLAENNFNVVLSGDVGSGKTSLALAIKNSLINKSTLFLNTPLFVEKIKSGYGRKPYEDISKFNVSLKRAIVNTDVLILDDFGSEANMTNSSNDGAHQYLNEIMYEIAEKRFGKTNIVTTNIVSTNNLKGSEALKKIYSPKIISRLVTRNPDNVINFADIGDYRRTMS